MREALTALLDGRLADVLERLVRCASQNIARDDWSAAPYVLEWAADGALLLGDPAAVAPLADLYDSAPAVALTRLMHAQGGRVRARRAAASDAEDAAADAFAAALAAARSFGQAGHLAPVLADYGMWLVDCGRSDDAEPLLEEARTLFGRMGARRWLDRMVAALPAASTASPG